MKIALFIIFCVQLFGANAQTFCLENFGSEWGKYGWKPIKAEVYRNEAGDTIYKSPNKDSLFFANDTITFVRSDFNSEFEYLSLNCKDSTYILVKCIEVELEVEIQKTERTFIFGYLTGDEENGIWSLHSNTLSFKPNRGNTWFRFKIEHIGTKETNKMVRYTNTGGDYRTSIRLIRIE